MIKGVPAAVLLTAILLAPPSPLFAQTPTPTPPPWSTFTYIDWNPGLTAAIAGGSSDRHYECRTVWDGTQFVNIHEQDSTAPNYYSLWVSHSSDGKVWTTPTPIDVPRDWNIGHHAVACDPDNFPATDTMNGDTDIKFKLWYAGYGKNYRFRYSESSDGISWSPVLEYDFCPPKDKVSDFDPGSSPNTTKIMVKPDVLYRPDGSATLDTDNPMDNRYIMYLGSSHTSGGSGDTGYFEMYISHNGLDWKLYAWDQQCQDRWDSQATPVPTPEVYDIITLPAAPIPPLHSICVRSRKCTTAL